MNDIFTEKTALKKLSSVLEKYFNTTVKEASPNQIYKALAMIIKDILFEKREAYHQKTKKRKSKRVHYLCMEFLLGRSLKSNLFNLGLESVFTKALKMSGVNIENIYELEPDAALGNGGLGRLAACFLDSLATCHYPAMGHCIKYEYGLFKQKIVDSEQVELPDAWLSGGDVWLEKRQDKACIVRFGGYIKENYDEFGKMTPIYYDHTEVEALPYDMVISGYDSESVTVLRLWEAKSLNKFDMKMFSLGEYAKAVAQDAETELISKVLYPSDDHTEGKTLKLKQQYFLVSASLQNIIGSHINRKNSIEDIPNMIAVHINDTHPALCIPELMRILMDDYSCSWDRAWKIVISTVSYTNHTIMSEALESWGEELLASVLPRIYQIIKEINRRFFKLALENENFDYNVDALKDMAIISKNYVRMANLSVIGSHKVNGVSKLHSEILKNTVFREFSNFYPDKFLNITNGITHRRWLCQSNPLLTAFIKQNIGTDFYTDPMQLKNLIELSEDKPALNSLAKIKLKNKENFAKLLNKKFGISVNPFSRFDVHVKRIHEYKRQLLNVLKIIYLYEDLLQNPDKTFTPQTFFFGGKAAPSYYLAKRIIKLINQLGKHIDNDERVKDKLKVIFIENYNVTMAESLMPAAEVSEQISLAGKEASGTGNMKFMINGALTIGTFDGANVEMSECCGLSNMFIFGLTASEAEEKWKLGYNPKWHYDNDANIRLVIDALKAGFNGESFADIAEYLINGKGVSDPYMCLADFDSYLQAHYKMDKIYNDAMQWNKMSMLNIAGAGFFSSDRSIDEYASLIWRLKRIN